MRNVLLPGSRRFPARIYALSGILATMLLRTGTVTAQVEPVETEPVAEEDNRNVRIGIYLSGYGVITNLECSLFGADCIDSMPYPTVHTSVGYNNYQLISFWSRDENESILNFTGRYNYHPLKKYRFRPFGFAGLSMWHFNRRWAYRVHNSNSLEYVDECEYYCGVLDSFSPNLIRYEKITDTEFTYEISRDRPDGRSTMLGLNGGLGIEYNISGLVFTHEINWYVPVCSYDEFVCTVRDFKFLGLHLSF